jgi:hypothetical protein
VRKKPHQQRYGDGVGGAEAAQPVAQKAPQEDFLATARPPAGAMPASAAPAMSNTCRSSQKRLSAQ